MLPLGEICLEIIRSEKTYQFLFQSSNTGYEYSIWFESKCIGRVNCGYEENDSVKLYDINLYSSAGLDHRKKGLGSILLGLAVDHAKTKKAIRIFGSIIQTDIELKPDLIDWYFRNNLYLLANPDPMGNLQIERIL